MRIQLIAATALVSALMTGPVFAEDISGTWKTEPGDTGSYLHVAIAPCGEMLCGTIAKAIDKEGAIIAGYEHLGKQMIWDMKADGEDKWSKGKIWAPDEDKIHNSKMALSDGALTISGCILGGLVCRDQIWQKAEDISGTWKTEPGDTGSYLHVAIAPCGEMLCGTIAKAIDKEGAIIAGYEHLGKQMIWDMKADGEDKWSKGKIWAPDKDKIYKSKMALSDGALTVSGCILGGLVCRGQIWQKVE